MSKIKHKKQTIDFIEIIEKKNKSEKRWALPRRIFCGVLIYVLSYFVLLSMGEYMLVFDRYGGGDWVWSGFLMDHTKEKNGVSVYEHRSVIGLIYLPMEIVDVLYIPDLLRPRIRAYYPYTDEYP